MFIALLAVGSTVGLIFWQNSFPRGTYQSPPYPWQLWTLFVWYIAGGAGLFASMRARRAALQALDDRLTVEEIQAKEAAAATGDDALSLPALWALTQQRIDLYHRLATSQSSTSFRIGQITMIVGFLAVIGLGILAALAPTGTAAIAASVVAVAGAALSGFVGATFMKSQSEASGQLREFFLQPVEFARLLGAERLLGLVTTEEAKEKAIEQVIKAMAHTPKDPTG